jgi:hypothetical protein
MGGGVLFQLLSNRNYTHIIIKSSLEMTFLCKSPGTKSLLRYSLQGILTSKKNIFLRHQGLFSA